MFGSDILEVAIGLIFVYLLLSLITSAIREGLEGWLKARASTLENGLRTLLQDKDGTGLVKDLYAHPLVAGLFKGEYKPSDKRNLPSYIPSRTFATALLDIVANGPGAADGGTDAPRISLDLLRTQARQMPVPVQRGLLSAIDSAQGDLGRAQANIEQWFDSAMDRVSGWYKRRTQLWILGIGAFLSVALNVNTLDIVGYLSHNRGARELIVAQAASDRQDPRQIQSYDRLKGDIESLTLPIGWQRDRTAEQAVSAQNHNPFVAALTVLLGWLLTTFAISLGAPFWFDVLNKFMIIRSTVKPHEKSPEESSEDRQTRQAAGSIARTRTGTTVPGVEPDADFEPHEWVSGNPQEGII